MRIANFLILFVLFFATPVYSQNEILQVLHVKGTIMDISSRKLLNTGDIINANQALEFKNDDDLALVLSNTRGRLVLFKNQSDSQKEGELRYYVRTNILPITEYTGTRSLSEGRFTYLVFDEHDQLIYPKQIRISYIPENDKTYYFLQYIVDGNTHKMPLNLDNGRSIVIHNDHFKEAKSFRPENIEDIEIGLFSAKKNKELPIKGMEIKVLQLTKLIEEMKIYAEFLEGKNQPEKYAVIKEYMHNFYGNIDDDIINLSWGKTNQND